MRFRGAHVPDIGTRVVADVRVCTHDTVKLPRQKQLRYSPTVHVTRPRDNAEDNLASQTLVGRL